MLVEGEKLSFGSAGILAGAHKPGVPVAAMVGHNIQQVAHAPRRQRLAQTDQRLIAAKVEIDLFVIGHIIFVVGISGENGVQIKGVDPQRLQIVEPLLNTGQIATVEDQREEEVGVGLRFPGQGLRPLPPVFKFVGLWVSGGVAVGKPVGEDLVANGRGQPVWGGIISHNSEIGLIQRVVMDWTGGRILPDAIGHFQQETVMGDWLADRQVGFVPADVFAGLGHGRHGHKALFAIGENADEGAQLGRRAAHAQPQPHRFAQPGVGVGNIVRRAVMVNGR